MSLQWILLLSVAAGGPLLSAWRVVGEGRSMNGLRPVDDPGPCVPPRKKSAPVGLRGYRRYFANDSLIGRPVPCTRDDKICFRHNLVFDPSQDRCEPIGKGRDGECDLRPNRTKFEKGGGIIGVCKTYNDPCKGYRMAYDGRCYRKEVVRDVICGCGAKPTRHFLGGVECRSAPAKPTNIRQPKSEGRCLIPDLQFPSMRSQFFQDPFFDIIKRTRTRNGIPDASFKCKTEQSACFAKGKISVKGSKGCYSLFDKGPCPREHIVALDIHSAVKGHAEGTCVHVRGGCPRGYKRMLFDSKCHEERELAVEAPGYTIWNEYGQIVVLTHHTVRELHLKKLNNFCRVEGLFMLPGMWERRPEPPCGADNKGLCSLYEVEAEPPIPEL
ncbi:hypothetical protein R5R35_001116 [Gryllus longicercus]|uniref:Uncharacterized protein n=1 Tax=Gryllus longicercus TaxID=2509291 RepID=A0AAN9VR63_9ORTH